MNITTSRTGSQIADRKSRYISAHRDGKAVRLRDQVALQNDIVIMLEQHGPLPKKRLIIDLHSALAAMDVALAELQAAKRVERFRALSARKRMDEFWCVFGTAPAKAMAGYRAHEILSAFRDAAALHYSNNGAAQ